MLFFFWPLYCLSFDLWLLITPLASSDFVLLYCLSFDLWLLIIPLVSSNFFLRVINKDMLIVNISGHLNFHGSNVLKRLAIGLGVGVMVLNATCNNISVKSLQSVLLEEETGVPRENHRSVASP